MNKETLIALKGSIEKWEKIAAGNGVDDGPFNCPLCRMFLLSDNPSGCESCPVGIDTGRAGCLGSPFEGWTNHQIKKHGETITNEVHCPYCTRLVRKEVQFLKGLLPVKP